MDEEISFFSDNLPYRLPVWHSIQSANKKFSLYNNQYDLDIIPDYGGHMCDYDKKNDKFKPIKNDCLRKSPLQLKSHLCPIKINCESTNEQDQKARNTELLACDSNLNLLISTASYDHPKKKQLIVRELNNDDLIDNNLKFNFLFKHGNISQVNRFFRCSNKDLTYVRQDQCITVLELKNNDDNKELVKANKIISEDFNARFFYVDHNSRLFMNLVCGSTTNTMVKLNELNIDTNQVNWRTTFQHSPIDQPSQIKYTEFHPKTFFYQTTNEVSLFDTRLRSSQKVKVCKGQLNSICGFEQFRQISNSHLDPNLFYITSDFNLMLFDIRYSNSILMQWNHMLPAESDPSFLKNLKLEKETLFIANQEDICAITVDKSDNDHFINPISIHFPLHLPKLKNTIRCSNVVDLRLENYICESKIVGLDFSTTDDKNFSLYLMNQYGDIFRQNLCKTDLSNENEIVEQYEPDSKSNLNRNLESLKGELLARRRKSAYFNGFFGEASFRKCIRKPVSETYWSKFNKLDDSNDFDDIRQEMDDAKDELGKAK